MDKDFDLHDMLIQLSKKQDKILNLLTRIAKTLYLIPANAKEIEDIRITREKNNKEVNKAYVEANKFKDEETFNTYIDRDFQFNKNDIFKDVIGSDLLGSDN